MHEIYINVRHWTFLGGLKRTKGRWGDIHIYDENAAEVTFFPTKCETLSPELVGGSP